MWEREGVIGENIVKSLITVTVHTMEQGVQTNTIELNNPNALIVSSQKISFEFATCDVSLLLSFLKAAGQLL